MAINLHARLLSQATRHTLQLLTSLPEIKDLGKNFRSPEEFPKGKSMKRKAHLKFRTVLHIWIC